jgi:hypothetical protein
MRSKKKNTCFKLSSYVSPFFSLQPRKKTYMMIWKCKKNINNHSVTFKINCSQFKEKNTLWFTLECQLTCTTFNIQLKIFILWMMILYIVVFFSLFSFVRRVAYATDDDIMMMMEEPEHRKKIYTIIYISQFLDEIDQPPKFIEYEKEQKNFFDVDNQVILIAWKLLFIYRTKRLWKTLKNMIK